MQWNVRLLVVLFLGLASHYLVPPAQGNDSLLQQEAYRGPVDLAAIPGSNLVVTANELSQTVSLVDYANRKVLQELNVPGRPFSIDRNDNNLIGISCRDTGKISFFQFSDGRLIPAGTIEVGFEPAGLCLTNKSAYVGLLATGELAAIDLEKMQLVTRIPVGRWPRYCAVDSEGERVAVGLSGDSEIAVVDVVKQEVLYREPVSGGINIGHLSIGKDSQVYFPWMVYRSNPITVGNIRRGWVLASRIARIPMTGPQYREAIALDVPGEAVADPVGIGLSADDKQIAVTSSGTHELLLYKKSRLPFVGAGGPGDLIDRKLQFDREGFVRIELGGRPMGLEFLADGRILIANHTSDSVQIVRTDSRSVEADISLGAPPDDDEKRKFHLGMEIFFDAERSLDQWYSCHSCHLDGRTNAKPMDTWNDGTELTPKTVLPLYNVTSTSPWTWHGWQEDLRASLQNSFVSTMQGHEAEATDVDALMTYLASLKMPESPFLSDSTSKEPARRGEKLFRSDAFGCAECHTGPNFTDGLMHDVGMVREKDYYKGYNTPSLRGVYHKTRFLHDGRAKTLERVLTKYHRPDEIGGGAEPTDEELQDLIAYLKTL